MKWASCLKSDKVRKSTPNPGLIKALIEMAGRRSRFLETLKLTEENASFVFVEHYEMLREILEALVCDAGFKSYSHECLEYFLRDILKEEALAVKFDRLRMLRNGVNYYGEPVHLEEAKKAIKEIPEITNQVKRTYLKKYL